MDTRQRARPARLARRLSWALALVWLLASLPPAPPLHAAGTILYVNDDAPGPVHDGSSWATAYISLHIALSVAPPGSQLWVAAGTYTPKPSGPFPNLRTFSFFLKSGVALYGGFAGTETQLSQRAWQTHVTVLSGDMDGDGDSSDNVYHVVTASGVDSTAVLDGFTISGGNADSALGSPCGPACGGGLYSANGGPTLAHLLISDNQAKEDGGGLYTTGISSPNLTQVTFSGNDANNGGGMYDDSEHSRLTDVLFSDNQATVAGGGLLSAKHTVLRDVTFRANHAGASGGGGLYSVGSPDLNGVIFAGNSAVYSGGGMDGYGGYPSLTNVLFVGNFTTFPDAGYGGGLYNSFGQMTLTNVTFSSNQAPSGSAIYNMSKGQLLLQNSIVWGRYDADTGGIFNQDGSTLTLRTSLVHGGLPAGSSDGGGNLPATQPPAFVRAPDPGDNNWATPADNDYGDLRLQPDSPAIDGGDNAADLDGSGPGTTTPADVPTDLAGAPRLASLRTSAAVVDLGAYETPNHPPAFTSTPVTSAKEGVAYAYAIRTQDPDPPLEGVQLTLQAFPKPDWLTFTDYHDGTARLAGTPTHAQVGQAEVRLLVFDAGRASAEQFFTLVVSPAPVPNTLYLPYLAQ